METVQLIDQLVRYDEKRGRVQAIQNYFSLCGLTIREKTAIEEFLFNPTRQQAIKALKCTPKAVLFVWPVINTSDILKTVNEMIMQGEVNGTYIRVLIVQRKLKGLRENLLNFSCGSLLRRKMLQYEMTEKLKR